MITNYDELQDAITSFPDRPDLADTDVQTMISLAEARLNRLLKTVETEAPLTGVANSRSLDISALNMVEPIALKFTDNGVEYDVELKPFGVIDYVDTTCRPSFYEINGTTINFNVPLDSPYPFRFVYKGRFALSDDVPTNKLLTDNPDVYLAACMVWGGIFTQDEASVSMKGLLDEFIAETQHQIAQSKRAVLTPDPMFGSLGRPHISGYRWFG